MKTPESINGWENFHFKEFIGRDIEQKKSRRVYRGPIARFAIQQDPNINNLKLIYIYVEWLAVKNDTNNWNLYYTPEEEEKEICTCVINMDISSPYSANKETVNLNIPHLGTITFLPPGDTLQRESLVRFP
jgi:hypothetical protein